MYRLLCAFTLLCSTSTFSQTLDGFMGIKFGSSPDSVKRVVLSKPGAQLNTEQSDEHTLLFKGLKFAGREVVMIGFKFNDNQFYGAMVAVKINSSTKIFELYKEIKSELNEKYFITTNDYEEYEYPYKKGDGLTEQAIQKTKANIHAYWEFKNVGSKSNYITLSASGFFIMLKYYNGALNTLAEKKEKAEKNKDY